MRQCNSPGARGRNSTVRVHADRRGVEDGVKEFRAQSAARHYFPSHGPRQFFRCFLAPGTNADYGAGTRQRKSSGSRRSTGAEDQRTAAFDRSFFSSARRMPT